jgi:uncharacterized protein YegL
LSGKSLLTKALEADGIAKQKLHVILLADTSRSMAGTRIKQVNSAIADIHKHLLELQDENSNVDFYVSILPFSDTSEFLEGYKAVNVRNMTPPTLKVGGYSNLHLAYEKLSEALLKESKGGMMPDFGGAAPIIILLSDGHPTKSTAKQAQALDKLPWFRAALKYGIAIEMDDERTQNVLKQFTGDPECVINCVDASVLSKIIRVIVLTASKVKSQSSSVRPVKQKQPSAHAAIKQQINAALDEIDDWEW